MTQIAITGGGAAGMAAAVFAARHGARVTIYEQNEKLGKKLYITGKGRCNFTNVCSREELMQNVVSNPRFLYSAFHAFDSEDTVRLFETLGMRTKTERGNRAFPLSDHASDVIRALEKECRKLGVKILLHTKVEQLLIEEDEETGTKKSVGLVLSDGKKVKADRVLLASGGLSYPSTGATGDGFRFAEAAGHKVNPPRPALVPLETAEEYIPKLQGLSLKNVTFSVFQGKKKRFSAFGEMLFTHFGVSGPLVLSASSKIGRYLADGPLHAEIDLKPALSDEQLEARLLREIDAAKNKAFKNITASLFPGKLRPVIQELSGIPDDRPGNAVTKEERYAFLHLIRHFPLTITGTRGFREAIITQGGVSVKEVNPSTMESKKVKNLYFAGELLDLDAYTGGFNLQIAWSTAYLAGTAMAGGQKGEENGN